MSFPFLQSYTGLGNSLQTAQAVGGAVGGWVELGRTTLGSANSSMSVSSLPDKRYYMVLTSVTSETSNSDVSARFNSDTGSNYARRGTYNGNADFTGTNSTTMNWIITDSIKPTAPMLGVHYISNLASKEKLVMGEGSRSNAVTSGGGGVAGVPSRSSVAQKWVNTSNAIDEIETYVGSQFNSGSELVVLGWDPADTHTSNFWEEIGSATGTGIEDITLSSTKKYIWFQAFIKSGGASGNFQLRAGNGSLDTGSNYSERRSTNGGSDATGTSQTSIGTVTALYDSGEIGFLNGFIYNNASTEKAFICHITDNTPGSGAGTAPNRREFTGRYINTSNAIDHLGYLATSGSVHADSVMKVWGAD